MLPTQVALRPARPQPIDHGNCQHDEEQRDLDKQEMAVVGRGQCLDTAREIPSIDRTGQMNTEACVQLRVISVLPNRALPGAYRSLSVKSVLRCSSDGPKA